MQALQQAQVARVAAQEVNEGELEGLFLRLEGTTLLELGLTGRVRQCVAGLMEVANRAGLAREEGWARLLNVVAVSMEGAGASGNDLVATAVEAIHGAENPRECAIVHWKWGQCCLRLGDEEQAYLELEEALYLARMLKWKFLIAECLVARGIFETQARSGSLDRAEECLQEALRLSAEGYYPGPYWKACYSLAGVWNGRRRSDERSNLGRQARRALKSMLAGLPAEIRRPYFEASGVLGGHGNLGGEAGTKELQEVSSSSSLRNSSSSASSWRSARDGEVEGG
jgi:tetratricopeptide (TPR) repeat protein